MKPLHSPLFLQGRAERRAFTLVEMIAVIGIIMILFGIAVLPFGKMMGGKGVDGAARMIGAQLRLARQFALSKREYVAVVMPSTTGPNKYRYTSFRSCIVDDTGATPAFEEWIPNTKWESLPQGAAISEADADYENDDTAAINDGTVTTITGVAVDSNTYDMRAILFKPSGKLGDGTQRYVTVLEGVYENGNPVARNQTNIRCMKIDSYTGRTSYVDPLTVP